MNHFEQHDITVVYSAGAYNTNQVRGKRASSTACARMAAESLGRKVFGAGFQRAEEVTTISPSASRWRLHGAVSQVREG